MQNAEVSMQNARTLSQLLRSALCILHSAFRELFDESAYARFLAHHELQSSRAAYAAFLRDKYETKPKPRCC
jgi:hypothetical protein